MRFKRGRVRPRVCMVAALLSKQKASRLRHSCVYRYDEVATYSPIVRSKLALGNYEGIRLSTLADQMRMTAGRTRLRGCAY